MLRSPWNLGRFPLARMCLPHPPLTRRRGNELSAFSSFSEPWLIFSDSLSSNTLKPLPQFWPTWQGNKNLRCRSPTRRIACLAIWFDYFCSWIQVVLICLGRKKKDSSKFLSHFWISVIPEESRRIFFSILSLAFTSTAEFYFTRRMLSLVNKALCFLY